MELSIMEYTNCWAVKYNDVVIRVETQEQAQDMVIRLMLQLGKIGE